MGSEEREREGREEEDGGDAVCIIHLSLDRKIRSAQRSSDLVFLVTGTGGELE